MLSSSSASENIMACKFFIRLPPLLSFSSTSVNIMARLFPSLFSL